MKFGVCGRKISRPCGDGIIDWPLVLSALAHYNTELNLSVECINRRNDNVIPINDPRWQAADPELSRDEVESLVRYAENAAARIQDGSDCYYPTLVLSTDDQIDFIRRCHTHLRQCLANSRAR